VQPAALREAPSFQDLIDPGAAFRSYGDEGSPLHLVLGIPMLRLIGVVPLGVGLSTLAFAWSSEFGGNMHVPVFFRLFFSFVALGFVLFGASILFAGSRFGRQSMVDRVLDLQQQMEDGMRARGMAVPGDADGPTVCSNCGAPISAPGVTSCPHCGTRV